MCFINFNSVFGMQAGYNQAGCLKIIMLGICLCGLWINSLAAAEYFDPAALELSSEQQNTSDLSYFARAGVRKDNNGGKLVLRQRVNIKML